MTDLSKKAVSATSLFALASTDDKARTEIAIYLTYHTIRKSIQQKNSDFVLLPRIRRVMAESFNIPDSITEGVVVSLGNRTILNAIQIAVHPAGARDTVLRLSSDHPIMDYLKKLETKYPQLLDLDIPDLDSHKSHQKTKKGLGDEAVFDSRRNAGNSVDNDSKL